jgi:competence protein ComEA
MPVLVELNDASRARLESVTGIGPSLAAALISERDRSAFSDWPDLVRRVRGIGPASARRLSQHGLRIQGQPFDAP